MRKNVELPPLRFPLSDGSIAYVVASIVVEYIPVNKFENIVNIVRNSQAIDALVVITNGQQVNPSLSQVEMTMDCLENWFNASIDTLEQTV